MEYSVSASDLENDSRSGSERAAEILRNVALILATPQGSSPMYRDFGLPQDFLDKPIPAAKALMIARVREAIEEWEPGARVVNVTFQGDPATPEQLMPRVRVEIVEDGA